MVTLDLRELEQQLQRVLFDLAIKIRHEKQEKEKFFRVLLSLVYATPAERNRFLNSLRAKQKPPRRRGRPREYTSDRGEKTLAAYDKLLNLITSTPELKKGLQGKRPTMDRVLRLLDGYVLYTQGKANYHLDDQEIRAGRETIKKIISTARAMRRREGK